MSMVDAAVGALAVALVAFTIIYNVRKRRRGEASCAYCSGCSAKSKADACAHGEKND